MANLLRTQNWDANGIQTASIYSRYIPSAVYDIFKEDGCFVVAYYDGGCSKFVDPFANMQADLCINYTTHRVSHEVTKFKAFSSGVANSAPSNLFQCEVLKSLTTFLMGRNLDENAQRWGTECLSQVEFVWSTLLVTDPSGTMAALSALLHMLAHGVPDNDYRPAGLFTVLFQQMHDQSPRLQGNAVDQLDDFFCLIAVCVLYRYETEPVATAQDHLYDTVINNPTPSWLGVFKYLIPADGEEWMSEQAQAVVVRWRTYFHNRAYFDSIISTGIAPPVDEHTYSSMRQM